jgi:hypothetical protein
MRGFIERDVATATIAAAAAVFADMHRAGILRAERADARGFLLADAAHEGH